MTELNDIIRKPGFAIEGTNLIEASAGTGKTYAIQTLFLRMVIEYGFRVDRILVVTFTEAATKELRDRLRAILGKAALCLDTRLPARDEDHKRIGDVLALPLRNRPDDRAERPLREARLRAALLDFDHAAIWTIHGFCKRVLEQYAFECGHEFDAELHGNDRATVDGVCEDWWRRRTYPGGPWRALFDDLTGFKLDRLKVLFHHIVAKPDAVLAGTANSPPRPVEDLLHELAEGRRKMLELWSREEVETALAKARVSGSKLRASTKKKLFDALDDLAAGRAAGSGLDHLEKLTPGFLGTALIRNSPGPPDHPFFEANAHYFEALKAAKEQLFGTILSDLARDYRAVKNRDPNLTYDDLLLNVRDALRRTDRGLPRALSEDFDAALIDEFQDTDPIQYEIFQRAFVAQQKTVFLVGDPKQAIYGFRNGDIFTYYTAAADVPTRSRFSLERNFRSARRLVDAVNVLFRDEPDQDRFTFKRPEIRSPGKLEAKGKDEAGSLTVDARSDEQPFKLWYYTGYEPKKNHPPGQATPEARRIYADTAEEIVRLLDDPGVRIGARPVRPRDIAVLVLTHSEANSIARQLEERRVPVALQSTGNVFDTLEAADMALLLAAMADPTNLTSVRSALATDLFPVSDAELASWRTEEQDVPSPPGKGEGTDDPDSAIGPGRLASYVDLLRDAHERWRGSSFIEAFGLVSARIGLREHLAGLSRGERRLTNVLQLTELLHGVAMERRLGVENLTHWMAAQLDTERREEEDAHTLRLETDAEAVRILTVFRSKGLEFPIVFVPTMWRRKPDFKNASHLEYHQEDEKDGRTAPHESSPATLVIQPNTKDSQARDKAVAERIEEDIRLIYVAVTRAIHRVYLVWGALNNDGSAMEHLMAAPGSEALAALLTERAGSSAGAQLPIEIVARGFGDAPPPRSQWRDETDSGAALNRVAARPEVDRSHGHTSFTDIAPHEIQRQRAGDDRHDFDPADVSAPDARREGADDSIDIFTFPGGPRTGQCWHRLFEHLSFAADDAEIDDATREHLTLFGLHPEGEEPTNRQKRRAVAGMVKATLRAELPADGDRFSLCDVENRDRLTEMEFSFALRDEERSVAAIRDVLERHWPDAPTPFLERLHPWDGRLARGFLTGFIDLVFRNQDRYFVLDWKSNQLDRTAASFNPSRIEREMADHAYFVQYLLYTAALHLHLKSTRGNAYRYDDHFGGVLYLFLRGARAGTDRGVFYHKPRRALIEALAETLLPRQ